MEKYALVTGASRGIGRSIALVLAERGYNLLITARSENELSDLASLIHTNYNVKTHWLVCDLSQPESVKNLVLWVNQLDIPIAILVNNAGYGLWGKFEELSLAGQLEMLRLNIDAVVSLSHHLLPLLHQQQQAYILNVASTAAYQAVPTLAVYAASKAAVLSFSRALRYELRKSSVSVSCLSPGPTDTGFAARAGMAKLAELAAKFNMSPDEVAKIAIKGMFNSKAEIVPGKLNKLSAFMVRLVSKNFVEGITGRLYDK